jgi:hypothetical protein
MSPTPAARPGPIRIRVTIGDLVLTATLRDNPAARSFVAQLPATMSMSDYGGQEKLGTPACPLSTEGMPPGDHADSGDIAYYAPSDTIVFYYTAVGYFRGIARMGRFDDPIAPMIGQPDGFTATVELERADEVPSSWSPGTSASC